tara:strand:+ start:2269 stop:3672 length:1404 start_codon:yes stop_codon:yes gene_type:complete
MGNESQYSTLPEVIREEDIGDQHMLAPENALPLGNNSNPLIFNFAERLRYRNATYFEGLPKPIDTLYDKVFYGKVDRYQNAIVPKKGSSLLAQTSYDRNVFALDFVADAFFKLKRNLTIAADSGAIVRDTSVFHNIQATRGWFNYERKYRSIFALLIQAHNGYLTLLDKKEFNKIITFADYVWSLQNFLKLGVHRLPISLTEYVLSPRTPPRISGLTLDISEDSFGNDLNKYTKYFLDPNFSYYVRAARKFGFYVDRNGPWRLFADVFSPPMAGPDGFIEGASHVTGAIEKNFFNSYYDRTYTLDIPLMKEGLLTGFNQFARNNSKITETVLGLTERSVPRGGGVGTVGCGTPVFIKTLGYRHPVTATMVDDLGDPYWLAFYFNIRMSESGVRYKNSTTLIKEAVKVAAAYDYNQALIYINNLFKPYLYDERIFKKHLTQEETTARVGSAFDSSTTGTGTGGGSGGY